MKENFYPLIFNLATKNILFIGGGNVAERKIILLLNAANIYVIAPSATKRLTMLYNSGKIDITFRKFEDQDIKHCYSFVFACTNNIELNRHIGKLCKDNNIFVFVAGDKNMSDFYMPAVYKSEKYLFALSTYGMSPKYSKKLRDYIKGILTNEKFSI